MPTSIMCRLFALFVLSIYLVDALESPIVIVPPHFRWNSTNKIVVSPIPSANQGRNVDISVEVSYEKSNGQMKTIHTQKLLEKSGGHSYNIIFDVPTGVSKTFVAVQVSHHARVELDVLAAPNVRTLYLQTDKGFYRTGETVNVRALPLTYEGQIYKGQIDFSLMNPDGFELTRHRRSTSEAPIALDFILSEHLYFGQWKVLAWAVGAPKVSHFTYTKSFQVTDYNLSPFILDLIISDNDDLSRTKITATAQYFHGGAVSGSISIFCEPIRKDPKSPVKILSQSQIVNGSWSTITDLRTCFNFHSGSTEIECIVRDAGTGLRGTTRVIHDSLATGFQLMPLRPAYTTHTKQLLFATVSDSGAVMPSGETELTCITETKKLAKNPIIVEVKMNALWKIDLPVEWKRCLVIQVKWYRSVSSYKSRERVLMLPNMADSKVFDYSLIVPVENKVFYTVGDHFVVDIKTETSNTHNYLVICNAKDIAKLNRVTIEAKVAFSISRKMIGRCVLYVHDVFNKLTDMFMFYVKDKCNGSIVPSRDVIKPGQELTITMSGERNGYAILRTIDEKLARLLRVEEPALVKAWETDFFFRPVMKEDQIRLLNLINVSAANKEITLSCTQAASVYSTIFSSCPNGKAGPSAVSDHCMQTMIKVCNQSTQAPPNTGAACDRSNSASCYKSLQVFEIKIDPKVGQANSNGMLAGFANRKRIFIQDDPSMRPPRLPEEATEITRTYFPHVWLFDHFALGGKGTTSVTARAPHSVGRWVLYSEFWAPGQLSFCPAPPAHVVATKDFFMEIDIPRNTYANESVTVKISVTGHKVERETKLSVCYANLPRQLCADMGPGGEQGKPAYTRIVLTPDRPVSTKTFNMRFFHTGAISVTFHLKREAFVPGFDYCDTGEILDSVKLNLMVSKRAETEEHYRRLVLSTDKPVSLRLSDVVTSMEGAESLRREVMDVVEYRHPNQDMLITEIHINLHDTDTVYSFTIDVAKFLPNTTPEMDGFDTFEESISRGKRGIYEFGNTFLTDVIKKLSVQLYSFKYLRTNTQQDLSSLQRSENSIGSLIADVIRFSDCSSNSTCGFAEYGRPNSFQDRSIVLTTLTTSLLCEAMTDEKLICGSIRYIHDRLREGIENEPIDFHDLIDLKTDEDKLWFLRGLLLHVSNDCSQYQCVKDDDSWGRLFRHFYFLDENANLDWRSVAALAYMGTNGTNHLMRLKMYSAVRKNILPYWSAGHQSRNVEDKLRNGYEELFNLKRIKSGDVLVNSLGILAFVGRNVESSMNLDFDCLADWIYEQKKDDYAYENALDTYFASRALYEFRTKKINISAKEENFKVEVSAPDFEIRTVNVTDSAMIVYLPTRARSVTIRTTGFGKVKAGVRILSNRRQRNRRELNMEDIYPVRIRVIQNKPHPGIITQTVCFTALSPVITKVEVTHGIFTGFTTSADKIKVLENSTLLGFSLFGEPMISSYAVHIVTDNLILHKAVCYEAALIEPSFAHEPTALAPVAITARHPVNDIIGQILITHPDSENSLRKRRTVSTPLRFKTSIPSNVSQTVERMERRSTSHLRTLRSTFDDSIDSLCFNGGSCSCVEMTCYIQCGYCKQATETSIRKELCGDNAIGIFGTLKEFKQVSSGPIKYNVFSLKVLKLVSQSSFKIQDHLIDIWLRDCNSSRCTKKVETGNDYIIIGNTNDIITDNNARHHYVLRLNDRLERSEDACTAYLAIFFGTGFDYSRC